MGTKCTVFTSDKGDVKADLAFFNNYSATAAPAVTNDITQGYRRGSVWMNRSVTPNAVYMCTDDTTGAAVWQLIEAAGSAEGQIAAPAASTPTGTGGTASLTGGAGGTTSGPGGPSNITGGAGTAGNANGGDVTLAGGAANGSGVNGVVRENGVVVRQQGAPGVLNATGTLTAAEMLAGIVTTTSGAAVAATLDVATNMDLALPSSVAGDSFDFSIINTGSNTLTVGTASGWTLVGTMTVVTNVSGRFRARKTGAGAWTLYRLS